VRVYPHSGFAFHKHQRGQTSFAWRNCIMALPLNSDGLYTVAPASNSLLGVVHVKDRPDSHDLVSLRVDQHADGFAAALIMKRAQGALRQEVLFASLPHGKVLSCERFVALEEVEIERIEQGFLRIINEHFSAVGDNCRGSRTLYTPDGSEEFRGFVSDDPKSDVLRTYRHPRWLNVDDRLGVVFQGTGDTVYHNRHYFRPWWAVADDLTLGRIELYGRAARNEAVSQLVALLAPDESHAETASEKFAVLVSPDRRATGLIADGYLAAANMGMERKTITLSATRRDMDGIPIFPGTCRIGPKKVWYSMAMEPGEARLRRAVLTVETKGKLEVTASESGRVFAHNLGTKAALVKTTGSGELVRVGPSRAAVL